MTAPFRINSVTVPLIGASYLDAGAANLTPLADLIADVKASGANDVRVVLTTAVSASAKDNTYDAALSAQFRPADAKLLEFSAQLKAAGLSITWNPFVSLHNVITGSGDDDRIRPADFDTWIANHKTVLVHEAQIAQQAGAARFILFSDEVQHLLFETPPSDTGRIAKWLDLIQSVRAAFKGELTSLVSMDGTIFANGATHVGLIPVPVIQALDTIGVGLFPDPLTATNSPTLAELTQAWYGNANGFNSIAALKSISEQFGKKVWIADRAFHSFDGANVNHSQIFRANPLTPDPQEQADMLDSFLRAFSLEQGTWFDGLSIQNMNRLADYTSGVARFLDSAVGENFQDKPAESVLAAWFNGQRQSTGVTRLGTAGSDRLEGGYHHDTFNGGQGSDRLDGGAGLDTAVYAGRYDSFTVARTTAGYTVTDKTGVEGADTLVNVERLRFADVMVAIDTGGNGGMAYRLYQAAFNRTPDTAGLGFQINALDKGLGLSQVAANFIASPEFQAAYGALDHSGFVTQLYQNVLHRAPDAAGLAFHTTNLANGVARADVLVGFSESAENQAALIGTIQNGMVVPL